MDSELDRRGRKCSLGQLVGFVIAWDTGVAGYPVDAKTSLLRVELLGELFDGGEEVDVLLWFGVFESLHRGERVGVDDHRPIALLE